MGVNTLNAHWRTQSKRFVVRNTIALDHLVAHCIEADKRDRTTLQGPEILSTLDWNVGSEVGKTVRMTITVI